MSDHTGVRRTKPPRSTWDREEALDWYRRAKEKYGRRPTLDDMLPYTSSFVRLFGSIREFQRAAGDEPRPQGRPKREDVGR